MGERGKAPTPTKILALRGSPLAKLNPAEPKPEAGTPRMPSSLKGEAKKCWQDMVPQIAKMGILTKIDVKPLERYCLLYEQWLEVQRAIRETEVLDDCRRRLTLEAKGLVDALLRIEREFGLTPSSRTRISTDIGDKKPSKAAAYLNTGA